MRLNPRQTTPYRCLEQSQILIMLDPICYADNANFILGAHSRKFLQHKKGLKDSSAEVWLFWLFIDLGSWGFIETRVEILSCDVQAHCGSPCGSLALWSHCGHGRSTYWILFTEYWIRCFPQTLAKYIFLLAYQQYLVVEEVPVKWMDGPSATEMERGRRQEWTLNYVWISSWKLW